jgi:hypothetical protein
MRRRRRVDLVLEAACGLTLALAARPVRGQSANGGFRLAVAGGPTINDLETSGIDWIFVGGFEIRPQGWPLVITADVRYLTWTPSEREHLVMPEIGLQLQTAFGPIHPFIGAGGGVQYAVRSGDNAHNFTSHLATGLRIRLTHGLDLRLEARGRTLDPSIGLTAGLAFAL